MKEPTNIQFINHEGQPAFVVVPYEQWLQMTGTDKSGQFYIPIKWLFTRLKMAYHLLLPGVNTKR